MTSFKSRYFKRKTLLLQCRTVTPMFLGNADQEAEWRAEPFKALLRYWWRIANNSPGTEADLLKRESDVFGYAGDAAAITSQRSDVNVEVLFGEPRNQQHLNFKDLWPKTIHHPEAKQKEINPLEYLGGMGLVDSQTGNAKHTCFPSGAQFTLQTVCASDIAGAIENTLAFVQAFGAIGARCRNGWGSFQIERGALAPETALPMLDQCTIDWKSGLHKDHPNCLGRDDKGPLLWKTKQESSWQAAMRELADSYVGVRARDLERGIKRLDQENGERHLLGIPLTHHNPQSPRRYASPLRFVVRRTGRQYSGFILHLPQHFGASSSLSKERQEEVWKLVHRKLDHPNLRLSRASYEELL